ncbi:tegument protein U75 [Proboscivirus elephantidbeta4]|uniref:Tegument protein U75 n=1 Tax=Elephant endotheliotropic herpesvirus 4 TaxID=548914 RepID=A0A0S1TPQ3_9BETA|nr:tegument protein U75 [Elephant endotheliotropic herpesvirus 4]ALM26023.1 tegument protein U75 [Elephant endotheliotropic herpesvirus 4]
MIVLRHVTMIDTGSNSVKDLFVDNVARDEDGEIAFTVGHLLLNADRVYSQFCECESTVFLVLPVRAGDDWVTYYHMTAIDVKQRSVVWRPSREELKYTLCIYILENKIVARETLDFLLDRTRDEAAAGTDGTLALLIQSVRVLCHLYLYVFFDVPLPPPLAERLKNYKLYKQTERVPTMRRLLFGRGPQKHSLYTDAFLHTVLYDIGLTEFISAHLAELTCADRKARLPPCPPPPKTTTAAAAAAATSARSEGSSSSLLRQLPSLLIKKK